MKVTCSKWPEWALRVLAWSLRHEVRQEEGWREFYLAKVRQIEGRVGDLHHSLDEIDRELDVRAIHRQGSRWKPRAER